jgi:hypothetical protein
MNSHLLITLSPESAVASEVLILEQEEWDANINEFTTMDLIDHIEDILYGTSYSDYRCAVEDGTFVTAIFVYPYDVDLVYDIGVTWGNLSSASIGEVEVKEAVNFALDSSASLKYPVQRIISYEWYEGVWDEEGNPLTEPAVVFNGNDVELSSSVYGSLKVVYTTERHTYRLEISARENVVENFFSSVVYTRWEGGVKLLDVEAPANAEDDYFNGFTCKNRSIVTINGPEPFYKPPVVDPENETVLIDYCSQQEL